MFVFTIEDLSFISYSISLKNRQDVKDLEKSIKINDTESISFYEDEIKKNNDILSKIDTYINENFGG